MTAFAVLGLLALGILTHSRIQAGDPASGVKHWAITLEGVGVIKALDTNQATFTYSLGDVQLTRASGSALAPKFPVPVYSATNDFAAPYPMPLEDAVSSSLALGGRILGFSADGYGHYSVLMGK